MVAGLAVAKVMSPVCVLSPKVIVPLDVVSICANSVLVRLMPGLVKSPPTLIGNEGSDVRITTPPAAGASVLANSFTVPPLYWLLAKRSPLESNASAVW